MTTTWTLLAYPARRGSDIPQPVKIAEFRRESEAMAAWEEYVALADRRQLAVLGLPGPSWRMCRPILSVRTTDHPDVAEACDGLAAVLVAGPGLSTEQAAYKRWGQLHGYRSGGGGWVYRGRERHPVAQGWVNALEPRQPGPQYARVIRPGGRDMKYRVVERIVVPSLAEGLGRKAAS